MITRFGLEPVGEGAWLANVVRHWFLERAGPRAEQEARAASEAIQRRVEAAALEAGPAGSTQGDGTKLPADVAERVALGEQTAEP